MDTSYWVGVGIAALINLIAVGSASAKLVNAAFIEKKWNDVLGLPRPLKFWAGLLELFSGIAFLFPATIKLGTWGLTVYLVAAFFAHARIGAWRVSGYLVVMTGLVWLSFALRSMVS